MSTEGSGVDRARSRHTPPAPGGFASPQLPGATPDQSSIPGEARDRAPRARSKRRPETQYGTAQEIMRVFRPAADGRWTSAQFEQAPPSLEERRKADPAALPPSFPRPVFALGTSYGGAMTMLAGAVVESEEESGALV